MKIIDNKKDYYDYVSGIIGIDEDITYDRRKSVRLVNIGKESFYMYANSFAETCFSTDKDAYRDYFTTRYYNRQPWERKRKTANDEYFYSFTYTVGIEAGWYMYVFKLKKILLTENSENFIIVPELVAKNRVEKRYSDAPLIFGECKTFEYVGWKNVSFEPKDIKSFICSKNEDPYRFIVENPILANTWIPKFINAEEIWNDIYDYLISQREKPIIDNRSDVLHLEAAGFDKKTSFRNVK